MTPKEQNIAIATWLGAKFVKGADVGEYDHWQFPTGCNLPDGQLPDFVRDLNAMHKAEAKLNDPKYSVACSSRPYDHAPMRYVSELAKVCRLETREEMVISCEARLRPDFDKAMIAGPPFKLPVGVCILSHSIPAYGHEATLIHATAAQRAEALLRTLNLWTE